MKVIVACVNAFGESELVPFLVDCSQEMAEDGAHVDVAMAAARDLDYEQPMVAFDHTDSHNGLFDLFDWYDADIMKIEVADD